MRFATSRLLFVLSSAALAAVARTEVAEAQEPPSTTRPPEADAPAEPAPAAAPPPPTPAAPPPAPLLEPPTAPAAPPSNLPPIHISASVRVAGRYYGVNNGPKASAIDSGFGVYGELHTSANIHKNVTVMLNFHAGGVNEVAGISDAVIGFDFADPIHLWVGQMLVPADRANLGGPFFAIPWNFYPGVLAYGATTRVVAVPRENATGRDGGGVLWGDLAGKKFHYALGVFLPDAPSPGPTPPNAPPVAQTPLLSGRLSVAILGQESGYFGNSTYFGDQDIVAVGFGGQFQKDGSVGVAPTNAMGTPIGPAPASGDYAEFNSDLLVEKRYGGGGFFTFDGAYYHYVGNNEPIQDEVSILAAIATPKLGVGNLQPYGGWQWFSPRANGVAPKTFAVDAGVNYLIMGPALRIMLAFQHVDMGHGQISNVVQLGAQAMVF